MKKNPWWKRELKEVFAIASVFFVLFVLFLFMKKVMMKDYSVDYFVLSTALIGSLILAKVVLIFDLLPVTKKVDHLPNIYRVIFRSFIYLLGYAIFTFIEHIIRGLIDKETFSHALHLSIQNLGKASFITSIVGVFVAFLFFNTFWVIRAKYGPTALFNLFFRKVDQV
jgi:hypothetical protein